MSRRNKGKRKKKRKKKRIASCKHLHLTAPFFCRKSPFGYHHFPFQVAHIVLHLNNAVNVVPDYSLYTNVVYTTFSAVRVYADDSSCLYTSIYVSPVARKCHLWKKPLTVTETWASSDDDWTSRGCDGHYANGQCQFIPLNTTHYI